MNEEYIIDQCVEILSHYVVVSGIERFNDLKSGSHGQNFFDGELLVQKDKSVWPLSVEIKVRPNLASIHHWLTRLRLSGHDLKSTILFTEHIKPQIASELAQAGVNYVDSAGNLSLRLDNPTVIIEIKGNKPQLRKDKDLGRSRLSMPIGFKMLLLLLTREGAVNLPYREIALTSGVSLGSVGWIMNDLKRSGYVVERKTGLELVNRSQLFSRWLETYADKVRPKIILRKLKAPKSDIDSLVRDLSAVLHKKQVTWALTGEVAADLLTQYLVAGELAFFAMGWSVEYEKELRWIPSDKGNIVVLDWFSPLIMGNENPLVKEHDSLYPLSTPALIYAELLQRGSDRERETAERLAKQYLSRLVVLS